MLLSLFCALIFGIWMSSGAWFGDRDETSVSIKIATVEIDGTTSESLKETVWVALRNQQILSDEVTFSISPKSSELYARIGVFVTTDYSTSAVAKDVIKFQNFVPTANEGYTWVRDGEWYYFCDQDGKPVPLSHKDSGKAFGFMTKESFVMPNGLRPQHYASNDTVELEIRIESVQARNVEDENISVLAPYFSTKYPEDNFVVTFKDHNDKVIKTQKVTYAGDVTPPTAANITGKIFESWNTLKDGTGADISGEEFNNISQNLTLYPRYKSNEVTVTVVQTANGEITPGTTTTTYGNTLNFDVKANGGYKISSILIGGQNVEIKDENEQIVAVENIVGDTTLTATYELKEYLISVMSTGEGVTTPNTNQSVRFGDDISFTFVANEGKYISSLKIDGIEKISGVTTKSYEYTFASVSADHSVDVIYETSIYSITTNVVAYSDGYNYGDISPTENTCAHGKSVNFIVSAYSGAKISSIKVNGVEKLVGNNLTKTNINVAPTADTLVEVTFQPLWKMTKIDSKFYITDYLGNDLNLVVPAKIYDAASGADVSVYGVRSLNYSPMSLTLSNGIEYVGGNGSMNIFSNAEIDITNITLPNSITIIDSYAFLGCSEIINFVVPSKLQKIGNYAFQNCSNILSYDMPKTLIQIGVGAFDGNSKMSQLTFNSVAAPTIADGNIFSGTTSDLKVRVPIGGKASYVSNLSNRSFAENTYMYGLTGTTPIAIYKDNIFRYIYYIDILNSSGGSSNPPTGRVEVYQTQTFSVTFTPDTGNRIEAIYVDSSDENLVVVAEGDSQIQTFTNIQSSHLIEAVYSKMYIRLDINGGTGNQPLVVYNDDKTQFKINDNIEPTKSGKEFYYYSTNPDDNEKGQNGTRYDLGLWYDLPSTTSSTTLYAIYLTPTSYTSTSEYVVVPKTVNAIAGSSSKNMFGSTSDSTLKYITLHRNTITIGSFALYGCKTLTGISHSDGVVAIGEFAMSNCVELVKYRFAPFTQSVGVYAFAYNAKLGSITNFENTSVPQISDCMFLECSSIYEITLPSTIIAVGDGAFSGCLKLASIDLSKTKTATIGAKGFAYCENLSTIQLPSTLTIIDEAAFIEDKNLRSVQNLEKTIVSTINKNAFLECKNLSSVKLPQTLSTLGESAFEGCSNLTAVSGFENTAVKILEARTFANCSSLLTLSLARGLTEIKSEAMIGCSVLRNLDTLSTTKVTKIGVRALKDTAGLTSISLPTSTFVSFGQNSFENSGIQKINNLKNCSKFKSFGASSFMNSGLKEIEFPNCSFTIEANAFKNCTSLAKATFNSKTAPSAQETSFEGTTSALQVYIPNGSIDSYAPLSLGGLHNKGFSSGFDTTLSNYNVVEYIESTGTQYIDTGLTMEKSTTMRMEISAQLTSNGNWAGVNGYMQHQASLGGGNKGLFVVDYNGNTHIENVYFNDVLKYNQDWTSAYSGAKNKVAVIGMGNAENAWWTNISANKYAQIGKWYYIKVYRSGTLVRDYVPCVRNSDGVAGLYDMVGHKFYANIGSGSFKTGGVISADKGMSNGAKMHYIGKSQVVATCIEDIFKRHFDITMSDATYYFQSNTTRTIEVNEELPAGVAVKYTWKKSNGESGTGNSFKNVGTYVVTATISGGYYATTTATATLTIVQPSLSGITFTDKSFVYDGTKKSIAISGKLIEGASVSYSIKGVNGESVDAGATNGTTQVGVYEVTATFSGTLEGNTLVAYLTIVKASHRVTLENKSVIFDGNDHTINSPTLPSGMSIASSTVSGKEYDKDHNLTNSVSATENGRIVSRSNAGNYTITVNFDGGRNYNDTSSSATLVITPSSLEIYFATEISSGWTYDGKTHTISATAPGDVTISYSYTGTLSGSDNKFRDAGTYNLTATLKDNPNYYNSSASVTFTVKKANLTTTLNTSTFTYTGNTITYNLTNGIVGKGEDGTFSATACSIVYSYTGKEFAENDTTTPNGGSVSVNGNTATNAGWYSTKLVITAPLSSNNIQNYNTLTITGTNNFKITKASTEFVVKNVTALSVSYFINTLNFDENVIVTPTITYSSSDTNKVSIYNASTGRVYVTGNVVDRTSSNSAKKVVIYAKNQNIIPASYTINLLPFRYNSSDKSIIQYTSSKGNDGNKVVFPNKIEGVNVITNDVITSSTTSYDVTKINYYETGIWLKTENPVLSSSVTYDAVEVSEGITSLGYVVFQNSKITSATLPASLTSMDNDVFFGSTIQKLTLNSTTISFSTNSLRQMNSLKMIVNNNALSSSYNLNKINSKVWGHSSTNLGESSIDLKKVTIVSTLQAKGYYYAVAEDSVSVEADSKTTWFSTLNSACNSDLEGSAIGKTATVTVWEDITISSSIVLNTSGTNITLKSADYGCTVTRDAANFYFFQVGSGSTLKITSGIILDGAKDQYTTNTHSVIYVGAGTFTMSGGTIRNNRATNGGAIYISSSRTFTMSGGTISNCIATDSAGAIFMEASSTFTMSGGTISSCKAEKLNGGAIYISGLALANLKGGTIEKCTAEQSGGALFITETAKAYLSGATIQGGSATSGFGGAVYNNGTFIMDNVNSSIEPTGTTFLTASNAQQGGAIYNDNSGSLTLSAGSITGTATGTGNGGGIYNAGSATISGSIAIYGVSFGSGGGIFNASKTLTMKGGTIINSIANNGSGGGVYVAGGIFYLSGVTIDGCSADYGGGVYIGGGTFEINNGIVNGCSADYGGGVATSGSGKFNMTNGTISNNTATENGGGVWCDTAGWDGSAANAKITGGTIGGVGVDEDGEKIGGNTAKNGGGVYVVGDKLISIWGGTISNNSAEQNGGGIYVDQWGELYLSHETQASSHPTISYNTATNGGGLYWVKYGKLYSWNGTEISNNTANENGGGIYAENAFDSGGRTWANIGGRKDVMTSWTLQKTIIRYNNAVQQGGGLYFAKEGGRLTFDQVEITENTSREISSAIYTYHTNIIFANQTKISGNIHFNGVSDWGYDSGYNPQQFGIDGVNWSNNGLKIGISQDMLNNSFYFFIGGDRNAAENTFKAYWDIYQAISTSSPLGLRCVAN